MGFLNTKHARRIRVHRTRSRYLVNQKPGNNRENNERNETEGRHLKCTIPSISGELLILMGLQRVFWSCDNAFF